MNSLAHVAFHNVMYTSAPIVSCLLFYCKFIQKFACQKLRKPNVVHKVTEKIKMMTFLSHRQCNVSITQHVTGIEIG